MKTPILLTCLVWSCTSFSLDPNRDITQYGFRQFTLIDGLPQSTVQAITQTTDGFMWFGTQDGLARFNGQQFLRFSDMSLNIIDMQADSQGGIWIATHGRGLIYFKGHTFESFDESKGVSSDNIDSVTLTEDGLVWVACEKGIYFGGHHGFENFESSLTTDAQIIDIQAGKDGSIVVVTQESVIAIKAGVALDLDPNNLLLDGYVSLVYRDQADRLWLPHTNGFSKVSGKALDFDLLPEARGNYVPTSMLQDRDGQFWIGSYGTLSRVLGSQKSSLATGNMPVVFETVLVLFEDREGNIWVGTDNHGVIQIRNTPFITYGLAEGMSNEVVFPIAETTGQGVWAGTEDGFINRVLEHNISQIKMPERAGSVTAIQATHQGPVYVGTNSGLYRVDNGLVAQIHHERLDDDSIWALMIDRLGALWVGSVSSGVYRLHAGEWTRFGRHSGLQSMTVSALVEDRLGQIWVGTDGGGVYRLDGDQFTSFGKEAGLSHLSVTAILEDQSGIIWVSTHGGGLFRFDQGRFVGLSMANGLPSNLIYATLEDNQSNLWCSSTRGIFRLDRADLERFHRNSMTQIAFELFDTEDGLRTVECNGGVQACALTAKDGALWFATIAGIVKVMPGRLFHNPTPPKLNIEYITVGDQKITDLERSLSLGPGIRDLEINYAALSFSNPRKVRYAYKLQGFDADWLDVEDRKVAYYTNLPPGSYAFLVRADNGFGVWSETDASVEFELKPYFHQTHAYQFLVALVALASVVGLYMWRQRAGRVREQELKRLVEDRTKDLWKVTHKLKDANHKLEELSFTDPLTGVGNRRRFEEVIEKEWRRTLRNQQPISILMIDIDFFKSYNDTYGHQSGDECLKVVANSLAQELNRPGDIIVRYGGEEFIVFLPETDFDGAHVVAESMRERVISLHIDHSGSSIMPQLSISIGVSSTIPTDDKNWHDLVKRADEALYQSKHLGRNRVERLALA